jgi:hypothetical protein
MMVPGSIDGSSQWVEASSMARTIEDAMVAAKVINLDKEASATTKDRRNSFVAIATGLINYLKSDMEIALAANALGPGAGNVPAVAKTLTGVVR